VRNKIAQCRWWSMSSGRHLQASVYWRNTLLHSEYVSDREREAGGIIREQARGRAARNAETWALENGFTMCKWMKEGTN
jgi:hypothetical protein